MNYPAIGTKTEIRKALDYLADLEVIDFYVIQTRMPGLRWSIYVAGQPGRVMTTREVRSFIDGAVVAHAKLTEERNFAQYYDITPR